MIIQAHRPIVDFSVKIEETAFMLNEQIKKQINSFSKGKKHTLLNQLIFTEFETTSVIRGYD